MVGALLRDRGHTVWEAPNPKLVLQILEREHPIDLLLVDDAMPEMNGRVVIKRARVCQPGVKTSLMTAYPRQSATMACRKFLFCINHLRLPS